MRELDPSDGETLIGSYRIVREIGRGGMASVFEAHHTTLPRRAAMKVLHADMLRVPGMATRMVREASILEQIRHPGIVRVYDCAMLVDRRPWIAMELVEGKTLAAHLAENRRLGAAEVAALVADIADVLASVHASGIVHRDLKPDNLILTPRDRSFPLRLIDWGIARMDVIGRITQGGRTPGTPVYMSPEQAIGGEIAAPCDIYALGVIAYEALCGEPPFDGALAEVLTKHISSEAQPLTERAAAPAEMCTLVHDMLAKDPLRRPSALEVCQIARGMAHTRTGVYESIEVKIEVEDDLGDTLDEVIEALDEETVPDGTLCNPRWTPDRLDALLAHHDLVAITPRADNDAVAGEIQSHAR